MDSKGLRISSKKTEHLQVDIPHEKKAVVVWTSEEERRARANETRAQNDSTSG